MADGEQTAGQVIGAVSPALSAIPYVGPLLSLAGTLTSAGLEMDAANKQKKQAEQQRKDALNTAVQPMRPEFLAALHQTQLNALSGLPGMQQYKDILNQQLADQIRYIRSTSPSGNTTLAALGSAIAGKNQGLNTLFAQDMEYRAKQQQLATSTLWKVGEQGRGLEDIRDRQKAEGLKAAAAMENAATYNKQNSINMITGALGSTASSITKNALLGATAGGGNAGLNDAYLKALMGTPGTKIPDSIDTTPAPINFNSTDSNFYTPPFQGYDPSSIQGSEGGHEFYQPVF